jgi:hypothetical protein
MEGNFKRGQCSSWIAASAEDAEEEYCSAMFWDLFHNTLNYNYNLNVMYNKLCNKM